jgi:hypothetical protein
MNELAAPEEKGRRPLPLAIILPVLAVVFVSVVILVLVVSGNNPFRGLASKDDGTPVVLGTETPFSLFTPTAQVETPTPGPSPTATATSTSVPWPTVTPSATPIPTHTPTLTPSVTPTATQTPLPPTPTRNVVVSADLVPLRAGPMGKYDVVGNVVAGEVLPLVARTGNDKWIQVNFEGQLAWVEAEMLETVDAVDELVVVKGKDYPPTPTPGPTTVRSVWVRPTRAPGGGGQGSGYVPKPKLLEPRGGARFNNKTTVRFKFSWYRRLEPNERVSLYIVAASGPEAIDWWVSEEDILNGGGAIHEEEDRVVYEINSGFGSIPKGKAYWSIAIALDTLEEKRLISPRTRPRGIKLR